MVLFVRDVNFCSDKDDTRLTTQGGFKFNFELGVTPP